MPTSEPPPVAIIRRAAPCSVRNAPSRLTEVTRRNSSSVISTKGTPPEPTPALAEQALARGEDVTLADNRHTTRREQVEGLGANVLTLDVRGPFGVEADRVIYLAAQASRPLSWKDPAYTEQTNLVGARHVAQAVG